MSNKPSWLQRFWSRRVAASAYGGFAVTFIVLAIPPAWLADDRMRIIFLLLGIGCIAGFIYEWWFRKDPPPVVSHDPDVIPFIQAIDPRVRQAHREADGRIRLGLGSPATTLTMRRVLLAYFRNEAPTAQHRTRRASNLTALVTLDNVNMSASGFWLDTYSRTIDLEVGDEAAVAVAFVVEREHAELVNIGPPAEVGVTFWTCPGGDNCRAEERTVIVRLLEGGRLVAQAEYLIRLSSSAPDFQLVEQTVPQMERAVERRPTHDAPNRNEPQVTLEFVNGYRNRMTVLGRSDVAFEEFVFHNFSDVVAMNARATIAIPETDFEMVLRPVHHVAKGEPKTAIAEFHDGGKITTEYKTYREFFSSGLMMSSFRLAQADAERARTMREAGDTGAAVDREIQRKYARVIAATAVGEGWTGEPEEIEFDVECERLDGSKLTKVPPRRHVLFFNPRERGGYAITVRLRDAAPKAGAS